MNLFDLIKEKKYSKIITYLKNNPDLDLNIQDDFDNYFIEYVIDSNNIELISFVLSRSIFLDILDNNGTTLLYNLIKFNKLEILEMVINNDSSKIGIHILDKKDIKGRTSLHYCVIFNNIKALELILDKKGDPYIIDRNGDNIFFYCIKYKRNEILLFLFSKFKNFKIKNKEGETLLQSSINYSNQEIIDYLLDKSDVNLNNKTKEFGTTALHQLIVNDKVKLVKKLIDLNVDITISDNLGNNPIHFSILEKNNELILLLLKMNKINLNLTNLNGYIPLNLYLEENKKYDEDILKLLIENSNLNIQNFNGNTSLFLLFNKSLFFDYSKELLRKKLNIFIQNYKGESIYNSSKDKEKLIELVSKSFYNNLDYNLVIDWEKKCADIRLNKKNDNNKELKTEDDCIKKIKYIIKNENRSIPKIKEIKVDLNSGLILKDCFFSGYPIDTLFGLLWLKKNTKNLNLVLGYPMTLSEPLEKFYNDIGVNINFRNDFINTMILWTNQKIFFPDYFDSTIESLLKNKVESIIIAIGIETPQGAHTNIIFWNVKNKVIERFEPNGKNPPISFNYNPDLLDSILINKFSNFSKDFKYLKPSNYLPQIGFQMIENLENETCKEIGDPNGFCTVWCIWYCYQKSLNLEIESEELVDQLINNIKLEGKSFKNLIRNFSKNISKLRDEYLDMVDLNINRWILSSFEEDKLYKLEKNILKLI